MCLHNLFLNEKVKNGEQKNVFDWSNVQPIIFLPIKRTRLNINIWVALLFR